MRFADHHQSWAFLFFAEMADLVQPSHQNRHARSSVTTFDVSSEQEKVGQRARARQNLKALNYPMGSRRFARRQSQLPRTSECLGEVDENDYETDFMLYAEIPKRKATFYFR